MPHQAHMVLQGLGREHKAFLLVTWERKACSLREGEHKLSMVLLTASLSLCREHKNIFLNLRPFGRLIGNIQPTILFGLVSFVLSLQKHLGRNVGPWTEVFTYMMNEFASSNVMNWCQLILITGPLQPSHHLWLTIPPARCCDPRVAFNNT